MKNNNGDIRLGIDVGTNSVGMAAVRVDDLGMPLEILNAVVYIHDSGVDPEKQKEAITRLASAGVARRTRRLIAKRKKRNAQLDRFLAEEGFPLPNLEDYADPYFPWEARAALTSEVLDEEEFKEYFAVAVRHMIRHRGWRSPYQKVRTLHVPAPDSEELTKLKERVRDQVPEADFSADATPAETVYAAVTAGMKIRGPEGILGGKLRQSDNANELRRIADVQGLETDFINRVIDKVFDADSPQGASAKLTGKDELPGQHGKYRAEKASLAFQKYRIVSVLSNVRCADHETGEFRPLLREEIEQLTEFLMNPAVGDSVTWDDIATELKIERDELTGTAAEGPDGERPYMTPPLNTTHLRIMATTLKPLKDWWKAANDEEREALVTLLSNSEIPDASAPGHEEALAFLESLEDSQLEKLDSLNLPSGRAAYSKDSLERLTNRMLADGVDLFTARKIEFGVENDWKPSADPIGAPVGNPAVDRVLKIVNRWMMAIERKYGTASVINIEHVRDAFMSESKVREIDRENGRRAERNQKLVTEIAQAENYSGRVRRSDITRYLAVKRQNCQCAYCGTEITMLTAELDHIVPRKGAGSTNTRNNLLAACRECNHQKSNLPFALWVEKTSRSEVTLEAAISRVYSWNNADGANPKEWRKFQQDVVMRLKRKKHDDEIDNRSIESVAWMGRELRARIEWHYKQQDVNVRVGVYQGRTTANARFASGLEGKVALIGGKGKTRLDRRHHAVDALVIALMNDGVAKTLAERISMREAQRARKDVETWQEYRGATNGAKNTYGAWLNAMNRLTELLNSALENDEIPVMQNVRLRLGSGKAHDDKIRKLVRKRLGDAWSMTEIDRASTPQLWTALTRCEDFEDGVGLPENSERKIRVRGEFFEADDTLGLFDTGSAAIAVRGGYAEIGATIHHARIYRINGKKPSFAMVRVFTVDLL
ncbi:MAG: HNH endonuclease, partial [Arcanobacterium sp.]|nr:HNH endonuclease [Arcanobacterium sp.]